MTNLNVSKPLLGVLISAVVLFAMVFVVFRGPGSPTSGASQGAGVYQSAINKAHRAVATSNAANARLGAPVATTPSSTATTAAAHAAAPAAAAHTRSAASTKASTAAKVAKAKIAAKAVAASVAAEKDVTQVDHALSSHKVLALLFYNPLAADDVAVKTELSAAAAPKGVVKVAVPVTEISRFTEITDTIQVTTSPTLIFVDRSGDATTLTGYTDRVEISQRIKDALASK